MGLFDSIRGRPAQVELDIQKAIMTIVVASVKADGRIEDQEIYQIRSICAWSPIFRANTKDQDTHLITFADQFIDSEGVSQALSKASAVLSSGLREAAFTFAVRIILADDYLGESEKEFVGRLVDVLDIDEGRAKQIIEVVSIMNYDATA